MVEIFGIFSFDIFLFDMFLSTFFLSAFLQNTERASHTSSVSYKEHIIFVIFPAKSISSFLSFRQRASHISSLYFIKQTSDNYG